MAVKKTTENHQHSTSMDPRGPLSAESVFIRHDPPENTLEQTSAASKTTTSHSQAENLVMVSVRIPAELHRQIKCYAVNNDTKVMTIVQKALEEFLLSHQ